MLETINFISTYAPWIWVGILVVSLIIEGCTLSLTTIWAAIASFPMIFIAKTGLDFKWQVLIFAVLTVILIILTRPFAIKKLNIGKTKTNVDSLVGEEVLVVKAVSKFQKGEVKTKNGVIWNATSIGDNEIPENTTAVIAEVKGNTLILK